MISNVSHPFYPGDISCIRALAQKKAGISIVNHYYLARISAGNNGQSDKRLAENVKEIIPDPAHVNISACAINKYAKNKIETIQLVEDLASRDGSKGLAGFTFEHPLAEPNKNPVITNNDMDKFIIDDVTIEQLGENNIKAIRLMK